MSLSIQIDTPVDGEVDNCNNKSAGRWTQEEHNLFLQGLKTHNKQWKLIADMVKTRTVVQIRTHAQKYFQKLNKTSGWNKSDKMDEMNSPYLEHDGQRSYAYPVNDSRANSFCSSGDSVDSTGTSAEGVDSEAEIVNGIRIPGKPRSNTIQSNSFAYDHVVYSGSTSTTNSTLSSPTCQGMNMHGGVFPPGGMQVKRAPNVNILKVKGGELVRKRSRDSIKSMLPGENKPGMYSPKKSNFADPLYVASLKSRSDPDVYPSRSNSTTSPRLTFRTNVNANTYNSSSVMPGPLTGLSDDLGVGMGLGLDIGNDFGFPSSQFPDEAFGSFGPHSGLGCASTDTDLHFPLQGGYFDNDVFDDSDLMTILGDIDWNAPEPGLMGHSDSVSTTCANSRPLSPATDTASSVSSGLPSMTRAANTAAGTAGGTAAAAGTAGQTIPVKAPSPMPTIATTAAPVAQPLTCIVENINDTSLIDEAPSPKKHRVAYSNVIEELELVSQAVRENISGSPGTSDADHISLFDLFQRDGSQAVGRLPPLRALVDRARQRDSRARSMSEGIASPNALSGQISANPSSHDNHTRTAHSNHHSSNSNVNASVPSVNMNFDDHDFDLMGDDFPYDGQADVDSGGIDENMSSSCGPSHQVPPTPPASRTTSSDLFAGSASILDANGAINMNGTLLTLSMKPTVKVGSAPSSAASTPGMSHRKRGRPRKNSISNSTSAPNGTPSASTAKSLLPAMTHSLGGVPLSMGSTSGAGGFQHHQQHSDGQNYVVPVNAAVAQAYNYAVSAALNSSEYTPNHARRSMSSDHVSALYTLPTAGGGGGGGAMYNPSAAFGADIRLGMTRTMSSESDNMMAAVFDPKLYDSNEMGGMLDVFD